MEKLLKIKTIKLYSCFGKKKIFSSFFGKVITSSKKYHAHDEKNKFKIGDMLK